MERRLYEFERFRLDPTGRVLYRDDRAVPLPPKAADTLLKVVLTGKSSTERRCPGDRAPDPDQTHAAGTGEIGGVGFDVPEAYEAYLRARYLWNQRTPQALQKSITYFEKAIQIDPDYATAYAGMADSYLTQKMMDCCQH